MVLSDFCHIKILSDFCHIKILSDFCHIKILVYFEFFSANSKKDQFSAKKQFSALKLCRIIYSINFRETRPEGESFKEWSILMKTLKNRNYKSIAIQRPKTKQKYQAQAPRFR